MCIQEKLGGRAKFYDFLLCNPFPFSIGFTKLYVKLKFNDRKYVEKHRFTFVWIKQGMQSLVKKPCQQKYITLRETCIQSNLRDRYDLEKFASPLPEPSNDID